ncbi:hypothetical protein ASZ90_015246 [hydrocarbon metagenome]|uniref:Uncharacterized protein n=1 Tax=hydrocarbon metagenome TaxID=938273 RepID=A0A0W8F2H6_9ZZZZ
MKAIRYQVTPVRTCWPDPGGMVTCGVGEVVGMVVAGGGSGTGAVQPDRQSSRIRTPVPSPNTSDLIHPCCRTPVLNPVRAEKEDRDRVG